MQLPKKTIIDAQTGETKIIEMSQEEFDQKERLAAEAENAITEKPKDRVAILEARVAELEAILSASKS